MDFLKEIREKIGDALKSIHPEENQALFDCKQAIMKAVEEHVASETAELEKDYAELKGGYNRFYESDAVQHKEILALKAEILRLRAGVQKIISEMWRPDVAFKIMEMQTLLSPTDSDNQVAANDILTCYAYSHPSDGDQSASFTRRFDDEENQDEIYIGSFEAIFTSEDTFYEQIVGNITPLDRVMVVGDNHYNRWMTVYEISKDLEAWNNRAKSRT